MLKRPSNPDFNDNAPSERPVGRNHGASDWTSGSAASDPTTPAFTSLRHILTAREWPEAGALPETELLALLNEIEFELLQHAIQVDFLDRLPARVAYRGIVQMLDSPIDMESPLKNGFAVQHLDGCDSACESCFQLEYCSVAREILGREWKVAVELAGTNPSWSALFAHEEDD